MFGDFVESWQLLRHGFFVSESGFGVYFAVNNPNGIQFHVPLFFLSSFFLPQPLFFFSFWNSPGKNKSRKISFLFYIYPTLIH